MVVAVKQRSAFNITRAVVFAMVLREMKVRFSSNRLGGFWTLLEPIMHLVLLMLIFGYIRNRSMPGLEFPVFLLFGVVPFILFRNIALNMMDALEANRALFAYRQIQLLDAWIARFIVNFSLSACVLLLVAFSMWFWLGFDLRIQLPLHWALVWVVGLALAFGLGMIYCAIGEVIPEFKSVIRLVYFPLYLLSGVVFPIWFLPQAILNWLLLNPWMHIIELLRAYAMVGYTAHQGINLTYPALWAIVTLFIGFGLYRARRLHMMAA